MQSFRRSFLPGSGAAGSVSPRSYGAFAARVQMVARTDEPGSGRVSGARTLKELPRRSLAALGSAARAIAVAMAVAAIIAAAAVVLPAGAAERPVRIVALGDS